MDFRHALDRLKSRSEASVEFGVWSLFERLREFNVKLGRGKCEFLKEHEELVFLGRVIGVDGVKPDPRRPRLEAIKVIPEPRN